MIDNDEVSNLLVDLQSRLSFQDDTVQTLSDIVARQQQTIDRLLTEVELLQRHVRALTPPELEEALREPPPPHY